MSIENTKRLLNTLLDIAFEADVDIEQAHAYTIHEPSAIETCYRILVYYFGRYPEAANEWLKAHVVFPLQSTKSSLYNCCVLTRVKIQCYLMKILKFAEGRLEFIPQLVNLISLFNNVNASGKHIVQVMKELIREKRRVANKSEDEYKNLLTQVLLSSVSQDSIRNVFYFAGSEQSHITLKAPVTFGAHGICWTGCVRLEKWGLDKRQCIFSFVKHKERKTKVCELWVEHRKLVYSSAHVERNAVRRVALFGELQADRWYHLVLSHENKELVVYLDGLHSIAELTTSNLAKKYDSAVVGASKNPVTGEVSGFFVGEMATQYFYRPNPLFREVIRDLAFKWKSLSSIYKEGAVLHEHNAMINKVSRKSEEIKYKTKEFVNTTLFILDPKYNILEGGLNEKVLVVNGMSMNVVSSLNGTQLFFNKPAKDIFYSLGEFRTILILLGAQLKLTPASIEQEYIFY